MTSQTAIEKIPLTVAQGYHIRYDPRDHSNVSLRENKVGGRMRTYTPRILSRMDKLENESVRQTENPVKITRFVVGYEDSHPSSDSYHTYEEVGRTMRSTSVSGRPGDVELRRSDSSEAVAGHRAAPNIETAPRYVTSALSSSLKSRKIVFTDVKQLSVDGTRRDTPVDSSPVRINMSNSIFRQFPIELPTLKTREMFVLHQYFQPIIRILQLCGLRPPRISYINLFKDPTRRRLKKASVAYSGILLFLILFNAVRLFACFRPGDALTDALFIKLVYILWYFNIAIADFVMFYAWTSGKIKNLFQDWVDLQTPQHYVYYGLTAMRKVYFILFLTLLIYGCVLGFFIQGGYDVDPGVFFSFGSTEFLACPVERESVAHLPVKVLNTILHTIMLLQWNFVLIFHIAICVAVYKEFQHFSRDFHAAIKEDIMFHRHIESFRQRHLGICMLVDKMDAMFCHFQGCFCFLGTTSCFILVYLLIWPSLAHKDELMIGIWLMFTWVYLLVGSFSSALVYSTAQSSVKSLYQYNAKAVSAENSLQIILFINRMKSFPVGLTVFGLFHLKKGTILTMLAVWVAYAGLLLQFRPSNSDMKEMTKTDSTLSLCDFLGGSNANLANGSLSVQC